MKVSGIPVVLIILSILLPVKFVSGQEKNTIPLNEVEKLCDHSLNFDTVRPGLNTIGKGLMYYDYIILEKKDNTYFLKHQGEEKSLVIKSSFSDMDLEILKQNLLLVDHQSRIQIMEMIRKEKWDLNLGEAIRGFYQTPVF